MHKKSFILVLSVLAPAMLIVSCGKDSGPKYYTITWKNYNGATLEVDEKVLEGSTPEYNGKTPYRSPTTYFTYEFNGWNPEIAPVKADTTFVAQFTEIAKTVTFHTMDAIPRGYYETHDELSTENDEVADYLYHNKDNNSCATLSASLSWSDGGLVAKPYTLNIAKDQEMEEVVRTVSELTGTTISVYNLEPGTYYYQVIDSSATPIKTKVKNFALVDSVRTIYTGGNVDNTRDIGGYKTADGKTVKYGLIYRSANFASANKLFDTIATEQLKLKTELDVRFDKSSSEHSIAGVNYLNLGLTDDYTQMLTQAATTTNIKNIFDNVLTDTTKLPLDFHCTNGADRTGLLAMLIEGALGVSDEDIYKDYELTTFYRYYLPRCDIEVNGNVYKFRADGYRETTYMHGSFSKNIMTLLQTYGTQGGSISDAVVGFLTQKCNISMDTINAFRNIILA